MLVELLFIGRVVINTGVNKGRVDMTDKEIKKIEDRIVHIKKKLALHDEVSRKSMSLYARGFSSGKVFRLIAEKYFLETLLEKPKGGD